ncbi:hypothetical protein [Ottowia testudinis]|uniref:Uncharacterized protein n=1 Tax=Ottowia testudinis TaxID=2816950 RepID=A0A975H3J5_9BURK|nr:hypothetical protein [Ottowia testudinis]QTD45963.1 hypothetical protein J1M35_03345 [Ottowia testudinis]
MELEVPPCSDSELALLLAKWTERARTGDPLARAMADAFTREWTRRRVDQRVLSEVSGQSVPF